MAALPDSVPNPSLEDVHHYQNLNGVLGPNGSANANRLKLRIPVEKRYYAGADASDASSSSSASTATSSHSTTSSAASSRRLEAPSSSSPSSPAASSSPA